MTPKQTKFAGELLWHMLTSSHKNRPPYRGLCLSKRQQRLHVTRDAYHIATKSLLRANISIQHKMTAWGAQGWEGDKGS